MSKLVVSEFVTLDGVMEAPGGEEGHPHTQTFTTGVVVQTYSVY
jgi:hypothetical protein